MSDIIDRETESTTDKSWLLNVRIMTLMNQLQGLLRPSAHRDIKRYLMRTEDLQARRELLEWGAHIIEPKIDRSEEVKEAAQMVEGIIEREPYEEQIGEAEVEEDFAAIMQKRTETYLRKPHRAFRKRWMHQPANMKGIGKFVKDRLRPGSR